MERRKVSGSMENRIVTGLIVSDDYCKRVLPLLNKELFESDYAAIIHSWCSRYFLKYKEAAGINIEEVYKERRGELEEPQRDLIREFLTQLSQRYEGNGLNVEFEVDRTMQWIRKRSAEVHAAKLNRALEAGKLDKFEEEVSNYKKAVKPITGWFNPFDPEIIRMWFEDQGKDQIFEFPGNLGKLCGKLERGWLAGVLAPMKRGKSFMLQEVAVISILSGLRVAFFSLEMNFKKMEGRILNRITASDSDQEGYFLYPVFDCAANQDGTCKKPQRTNRIRLLTDDGEKPKIEDATKYKPCTACRGAEPPDNRDYKTATWYVYRNREKMTYRKATRKGNSISKMMGDNFRMKSYPMGAANMQHILSDLDALEWAEEFIPDVVIVDYADILAPEDSREREHRHRLDATWKMMKRIAEERHCLVFTASQGTRKSMKKNLMGGDDVADDIRKLAHVDLMLALNQTEKDKAAGVMKLSVVAHRHADFAESSYVTVLQQRALAQVLLDSEMFWGPRQEDHFSKAISYFDAAELADGTDE